MLMDFCSYNVRGLSNKASFIKDFLCTNRCALVALLETHVKQENASALSHFIAPSFSWLFNYESHYNGRIWLGWNPTEWQVVLVSSSAQQITCKVNKLDGSNQCFVTMIYAFNSGEERRPLWDELAQLHDNFVSSDSPSPWCLMGDFNVFLHDSETNGSMPRRLAPVNEFRDCISNLGLADLRFTGTVFTWWDGNRSSPALRKLDRVLVNDSWLQNYDLSSAAFLPRGLSDHFLATLSFGLAKVKLHKPFQVFHHLLDHDDFMNSVAQAWNIHVRGNPWTILISKLKAVKTVLKQLNSQNGNLHASVLEARDALFSFQASLPTVPTIEQRSYEADLSKKLSAALKVEEQLLQQKSRINWLQKGDGNNSFFFNSCKGRWNSNKILQLMDDEGGLHSTHQAISMVAVDFFKGLIGSSHSVADFPDDLSLPSLSNEDSSSLLFPFSAEDVLATMKSLGKNKSPGPDGFTPEFFLKAWSIVGLDVSNAILHFFSTGHLPRSVNSSAIALVPKQSNASSMQHFRPISCCNTVYKCISKMISYRMKPLMNTLISRNQGAFVSNRSIGDNVMLAQFLCRDYHISHGPPKFACKVDLRKAFDTLSWDFSPSFFDCNEFPSAVLCLDQNLCMHLYALC